MTPAAAQDLLQHDDESLDFCSRSLPRRTNLPQAEDYEAAILRNQGVISDVARELGVSRVTVHAAINRSAHLQTILEHARELDPA